MIAPTIVLASASPRRQELLRQAGIGFEVLAANIEETRRPGETPVDYVQRLAVGKARHVAGLAAARGRPVLGADTEVVVAGKLLLRLSSEGSLIHRWLRAPHFCPPWMEKCRERAGARSGRHPWRSEDEVLGKPRDRAHAAQMLRRLSGRTHTVLSALCLVLPAGEHRALSESRVRFAALSDAEIENYVASGEADDKAGAYAIQGRAAGFIVRLEGSYSGVMGLPLYELREILQQAGMEYS